MIVRPDEETLRRLAQQAEHVERRALLHILQTSLERCQRACVDAEDINHLRKNQGAARALEELIAVLRYDPHSAQH